jgi:protein ImuA
MPLITCSEGRLQMLAWKDAGVGQSFATGLAALDELMPAGLMRGAVHEVLSEPGRGRGMRFALLLARAAVHNLPVLFCDPAPGLYPPAVVAAGISLDRIWIVRPRLRNELIWAASECLRCKGVGAVIAPMGRLSMVEARRLQLAAESGGGVGILLRPAGSESAIYAAATRWQITPARGERTVQRFKVQLVHGHGGRVGQSVYLEVSRETDSVRAVAAMAHRSSAPAAKARASA